MNFQKDIETLVLAANITNFFLAHAGTPQLEKYRFYTDTLSRCRELISRLKRKISFYGNDFRQRTAWNYYSKEKFTGIFRTFIATIQFYYGEKLQISGLSQ